MQEPNVLTIEKIGTIVIPKSLPSVNEYKRETSNNRFDGGKFEKAHRERAKMYALEAIAPWWAEAPTIYFQIPLTGPVWLVIRVYRPNNIRRDIHNLFIKPYLDGFTDAGLWTDDNEKVVPKVTFEYCGVDKENPRVEFIIFQEVTQ